MRGPKPLSTDADASIDNPDIINDKPDMIIATEKKPVPNKLERPLSEDRPPPPSTSSYNSNYSSPKPSSPPEDPVVALRRMEIERELALKHTEKQSEHWVRCYWRPAMGWLYMIICFMDFVGFPLLTIFLPVIFKPYGLTISYQVWTSLTLSNGGLIHLAFGAILGVAAFTRGQEKIAGRQ
jgi:hypothetical protein